MKSLKLILSAIIVLFTLTIHGQRTTAFGNTWSTPVAFAKEQPKGNGYTEAQLKTIIEKKYLTESYNSAYVDNFKEAGSLRYNLFEDEMEFVKGETIYFLKKEIGRKVQFSTSNDILYKVYELHGNLNFFLVGLEGKNSLLVKQAVKFTERKRIYTSYDKRDVLGFKRKKDVFYLAKNDKDLVKIPRNKKKFYNLFEGRSLKIENYMKKNKLGHTEINDLKQIIAYYNTL